MHLDNKRRFKLTWPNQFFCADLQFLFPCKKKKYTIPCFFLHYSNEYSQIKENMLIYASVSLFKVNQPVVCEKDVK